MGLRDLVPWKRSKKDLPVRREEMEPFLALQDRMNRLFDRFFEGTEPFGSLEAPFGGAYPALDVTEDDEELRVTAELPGLEEKDLEVQVGEDALSIRGTKEQEREQRGKEFYTMERSYGSFHRTLPLPGGLDLDNVRAELRKGVLTIRLPKTEEARARRKTILIEGGG